MLVATAAWGQAHRPATDAFRVSWDLETDPVDRRIEGRVHNDDREQHTRWTAGLLELLLDRTTDVGPLIRSPVTDAARFRQQALRLRFVLA